MKEVKTDEFKIGKGSFYTNNITSCVGIALENRKNKYNGLMHLHVDKIARGEYEELDRFLEVYRETAGVGNDDINLCLVGGDFNSNVKTGKGREIVLLEFRNLDSVKKHIESRGISPIVHETDLYTTKSVAIISLLKGIYVIERYKEPCSKKRHTITADEYFSQTKSSDSSEQNLESRLP